MRNPGNRFFDPFLELRNDNDCTKGRVLTKVEGENFDHGEVLFRGKVVMATFAHPEIHVGQLVNMIEKPPGTWFATCMQPTWFMAPIDEVIRAGRRAQAAMAYLLKDNPRYWPDVTLIDKRGQPDDGQTGGGDQDDDPFDDWDDNGDGYIDFDEWTRHGGSQSDFWLYDRDGDGKLSREEFQQYLDDQTGGTGGTTSGTIGTPWFYNGSWWKLKEIRFKRYLDNPGIGEFYTAFVPPAFTIASWDYSYEQHGHGVFDTNPSVSYSEAGDGSVTDATLVGANLYYWYSIVQDMFPLVYPGYPGAPIGPYMQKEEFIGMDVEHGAPHGNNYVTVKRFYHREVDGAKVAAILYPFGMPYPGQVPWTYMHQRISPAYIKRVINIAF